MFQQQPGTWVQVRACLQHDAADVVEPLGPRRQRLQRLVPQSGQVRVAAGDIGGVGDDAVVAAVHLRQPVAVDEAHLQSEAHRVGSGDRQRLWEGVERVQLRVGPAVLERQCHRAAAGSQEYA